MVLGGAASGKSDYAEALAVNCGKPRVYLATAQALDTEMRRKIDRHIDRRGNDWMTLEAPLNLPAALATLAAHQVCLLDCATMWLSNQMLADADLARVQSSLMQSLRDCLAPVIVVSNEVGHGIVPDNAMAREFREAQGRLNIALAAQADLVVQVVAGLPRALKGQLP